MKSADEDQVELSTQIMDFTKKTKPKNPEKKE